MFYAIDRFEGDVAVLQDDDEHMYTVPRTDLPADVRQGDVLCRGGDGGYEAAPEETQARRERIRRLEQRLRGS